MKSHLLAMGLLLALSCSPSDKPSKLSVGGGVLIYPNVDVAHFRGEDGTRAFAVAVIGLSTVEVLTEHGSVWEAEALCPPTVGCRTATCAPVAVAHADVDLDSKDDLLVSDTDCGNWIVPDISGPARVAVPWAQVMPDPGPHYTLFGEDIDSDGVDEVVQANPDRLAVSAHHNEWQVSYAYPSDWPLMNHMRTTRLALPISRAFSDERLLALQRGTVIQVHAFHPEQANSLGEPEVWEQEDLEYEKPYSGFDHFTAISTQDCDVFALGIGLFELAAGPVPRELQLLRQTSRGYSATTLPTVGEVEHFTVLSGLSNERNFVVAFERQPSGQGVLELGELAGCGDWNTLGSFEVEFDWRTIDNPVGFTAPRYPKSFGVKMATWLSPDERSIELVHYDGFAVRAFTLELAGEEWLLESTTQSIHETRTDLVLGE